jgi:phenylacetaldehyde dehydrogenase
MAAPLAVGCTIVLKPAEITPMSMLYLMQLWREAGLPDGVINVVTGKGSSIGSHLASHPDIDKLSFTGSTPVGQQVGQAAINNMKHVTLELGGKSPMVAFEDANIDDIVTGAHNSVYFNAGQVCSAGSRLYVQRSIYAATVEALVESLKEVVIGDPLGPDTTQGPQISQAQFDSVMDYIRIGREEGATVAYGGEAIDRPGYYIEPTLFSDCSNDMRIVQEEIFGPVLCVVPFDTEEEAVRLANDNIYGLAGSVFTQDISRAIRVVRQLEAGSISVNTHDAVDVSMPFGGYKMSGVGKDMGKEQLEHFLETKSVIVQLTG